MAIRSWFLFIFILVSAHGFAQRDVPVVRVVFGDDGSRRLIDQLKETPLSQLESGVSWVSFDRWFSNLVRPNLVAYEVQETVEPHRHGDRYMFWIIAYTKAVLPKTTPWIEIRFAVVDADLHHKAKDRSEHRRCEDLASPDIPEKARFKVCEAWAFNIPEPIYPLPRPIGNQQLPQGAPQRIFTKLSELQEWVLIEQGKQNPAKIPF